MRAAGTISALAALSLAGCDQPTDGAVETQAEETETLAPELTPQEEAVDDTPGEAPDEDIDAENYE